MTKVIELVLARIRRPIVAVVAIVGLSLVLIGIVGGPLRAGTIELPRIDTTFRIVGMMVGLAMTSLAVFVDLHEEKAPEGLPPDLRRPWSERRAKISHSQEQLLRYVIDRTRAQGTRVSELEISRHFDRPGNESYYRLEHLRLLGFLRKDTRGGIGNHAYRVDDAYAKEIRHQQASQ